MARLTTIIPTFRRPAMLKRAIQSVLAQSLGDFEIHVSDDASGDETAELVRTMSATDDRIRYFCHPERVGMMANFASGTQRVRTPFFNILSDDDVVLPGFYETAITALDANPQARFFIGSVIISDPDGNICGIPALGWPEGVVRPAQAFVRLATAATWMTWTSMVFSREVLDGVGGINVEIGPPGDFDFEMRIAARYPAVVSRKPCAIFLNQPTSSTVQNAPAFFIGGCERILANLESSISAEETEGRIDRAEAEMMRAGLNAGCRERVLRAALSAGRRGQDDAVRKGCEILERDLQAPKLSTIVRLMRGSSPASRLARGAYELLYGARPLWWRARYQKYKELVLRALEAPATAI